MPLAPSSRGRPSPVARAEDRALPSLHQERRPLSAPGAFARSSAPLPPAAFATVLGGARHSVRLSSNHPCGGGRRSFGVRSTRLLIQPRQSPISVLWISPKNQNWGKDLSSSILQSSFQSASTIRGSLEPILRCPIRLSAAEPSAAFVRSRFAVRCPAGSPSGSLARSRRQPLSIPTRRLFDEHPSSRAGDDQRTEVSSNRPPSFSGRRSGPFEFVPAAAGVCCLPARRDRFFKAISPSGPSNARSAAKPRERLQSKVLSVQVCLLLGALLSPGCYQPVDGWIAAFADDPTRQ